MHNTWRQGHSWPQLAGDIEARAVAATAAYLWLLATARAARTSIKSSSEVSGLSELRNWSVEKRGESS